MANHEGPSGAGGVTAGAERSIRTNAGMLVQATDAWRGAFPGAVVGCLVMRGVRNPERSDALEARKRQLEADLRAGAEDAGEQRILRAYADYYRTRKGTYHVKAQREPVALRDKPIPRRAALVEAMFMAELKNLLLTAGHDLDTLVSPIRLDVTRGGERYVQLNGKEAELRSGDMMMVDGSGIIASVLRGPAQRTPITPQTKNVLFAVYAPAGVGEGAVRRHLEDIRANVGVVAPDAETDAVLTLAADPPSDPPSRT